MRRICIFSAKELYACFCYASLDAATMAGYKDALRKSRIRGSFFDLLYDAICEDRWDVLDGLAQKHGLPSLREE